MADDTNKIIAETFESMREIDKLVETAFDSLDYWEQSDSLEGQVSTIGALIAKACDEYAVAHGHEAGWVKKKAQDSARSRLTRALENGMGGYFG